MKCSGRPRISSLSPQACAVCEERKPATNKRAPRRRRMSSSKPNVPFGFAFLETLLRTNENSRCRRLKRLVETLHPFLTPVNTKRKGHVEELPLNFSPLDMREKSAGTATNCVLTGDAATRGALSDPERNSCSRARLEAKHVRLWRVQSKQLANDSTVFWAGISSRTAEFPEKKDTLLTHVCPAKRLFSKCLSKFRADRPSYRFCHFALLMWW
jgi:hypothetical protein